MRRDVQLVKRAMLNDKIRLTVFDDGSVVLRNMALDEVMVLDMDEVDEIYRFIVRNTR